jgi:chaperonin cofactor prefoldin
MFELETTKHELQILQKKIDTLSLRIDSGNKAEEYLTDQLQNVREQIKKFK